MPKTPEQAQQEVQERNAARGQDPITVSRVSWRYIDDSDHSKGAEVIERPFGDHTNVRVVQ